MKIDVVVPFHIKDDLTLDVCIQGLTRQAEVARILVVSNLKNRRRIESAGAVFLDEDEIVAGLTSKSFTHSRWGWYFQQILKLGMADWVETEYYLVVDADTAFLRPIGFFNQLGKPLYATGTEYHQPYFTAFEQLLNFKANREYSFIAHHMVFSKLIVLEMRKKFYKRLFWYDNIISLMGSSESSSNYSEYETYGHYLKTVHPEELYLRPLKWSNIAIEPSERVFHRLSKYFDYCSFHAYSREDKSLKSRINRKFHFEWMLMKEKLGIL